MSLERSDLLEEEETRLFSRVLPELRDERITFAIVLALRHLFQANILPLSAKLSELLELLLCDVILQLLCYPAHETDFLERIQSRRHFDLLSGNRLSLGNGELMYRLVSRLEWVEL